MTKPLIGVTPDEGHSPERPGRPAMPRYELKRAYADAVLEAGGAPLVLPYTGDEAVIEQYAQLVRGLVVTGGAFDIGPEEYGETARDGLGPLKPVRTGFERRLMERVLALGKPVFGVCGGMQLLNVVLGGSLIQDVPTEVPGALAHEQSHDPREPAHDVELVPGSRIHTISQGSVIRANTTHHQAVARLGRGLIASGRTSDGVVEAIESPSGSFVVGVQWHPELLSDAPNRALYAAFVEASR